MTALHKLELMVRELGGIPHLLGLQDQTPAGLLAHVVSKAPLTGAQRDYLARLTFLLALEALADSERLRQLVLADETAFRQSEKGGQRAESVSDAPVFPRARKSKACR